MPTRTKEAAAETPRVSPVPSSLSCRCKSQALDYYRRAFNAEEVSRLDAPDGRIMHACLLINGAHVMLSDEFEGMGVSPAALGGSPVAIHLIVDDADAWARRAEQAGGTITMPVAEQFWGARYGTVRDPFGHQWSLSTPVRTLTPAELAEAARAATSG